MKLSPTDYRDLLSDLLGRGLACETRMRGRSMRPAIHDGDVVTLQPPVPDELRPGDILLFRRSDGRPICHRLIRMMRRGGQRWVHTWGDASPYPDYPVPLASVLGRVERVTSEGREVARETLLRGFRKSLARRRIALRVPGLLHRGGPRAASLRRAAELPRVIGK